MRFLQPELLWHLLWILPAMLVIALISRRKTARTLRAFLGKHAEDPDYVLVSKGRRAARFVLLCGAVFFLVVAAARPSWGVQIQEMSGQGRDLLFVFDVSKSMLAKDVQPSRLAHAKWLVKELVKLNPGDRFGLIAFAGKGFLECPLTSDKTSFIQMLDELNTDSIPVGGTNIQEALTAALQAFKAAETQHRAVVLVTDGDELEGNSGKAVDEIIARRIPLFIAGIGDPSQPSIIQVPDGRGGVKTLTDASGAVVNSPLNEKQLGELARRTGGIYVRSTAGDPGIPALEKRIRALAPQEYESVKTTKPIDRFSYPLAVAFVLLLVWFVLSERAVRRTAGAVALLLFAVAGMPLNAQDAEALPAPEQTERTASAAPESVSAADSFNRGVEAHEKGELQKAVGAYEEALRNGVDQAEIRGKATQNLGVITHTKARAELGESVKAVQGQNLDEAQKKVEAALKTLDAAEGMYRDSLRETVSHDALSRNQSILIADRGKAEELKKKIEELKKLQQQTQQQTQQAKDQQQKENQQNKDSQGQQDQKNQQNKDLQGQQDQKNQQNKDSQGQQDQKNQQNRDSQGQQDQKNQQNKDSQSAQQMTDQAKRSAEDLQKKAQEMGQQNLAKSAEQAKNELEKARQEQKNGNGKSAEDHLKNALDALGGESRKDGKDRKPEKQDQSGKGDKDRKPEKQDQSGKDGKDQPNKDSDIRHPQQSGTEKKPEEGDIDKGQAASILEDMAKDEKNLRDAIKAYRKQRYRNAAPAKDW